MHSIHLFKDVPKYIDKCGLVINIIADAIIQNAHSRSREESDTMKKKNAIFLVTKMFHRLIMKFLFVDLHNSFGGKVTLCNFLILIINILLL